MGKISEKIKNFTFGIFGTAIDLVLFSIFIFAELGGSTSSLQLQTKMGRLFLERKDRIIRDAIYRAKRKNWIDVDGKLTAEGKEKLKNFLPKIVAKRKWDGKWYLVIFDIPEKLRWKRDILREILKRLGFAQLQASVWISAYNYFGVIDEIVKKYKLENYVIFAISDKLGKETSQALAERLWRLERINLEYKEVIEEYKRKNEEERFWLRFKYLDTLRKDPQLPAELLPQDWVGKKAHFLFLPSSIRTTAVG